MRETPRREAGEGGGEGGEEDERVEADFVGEDAKGPLADDLGGTHDGEEHGAVAGGEADGCGVRGEEERGEEEAETLGEVGETVDEEEGFEGEGPICSGDGGDMGRGDSHIYQGDERAGEEDHGDGDGSQSDFVPVFV